MTRLPAAGRDSTDLHGYLKSFLGILAQNERNAGNKDIGF
jgi:hypothetical protein